MSESLIKSCWVLTEGIAGTENQCLGLAEALGVTPVIKRVKLRFPWKQLSPWLDWGHKYALAKDSDPIAPPWPDLLISSGRKSVGIARYVRKASGGKTFVVQIQDPRVGPKPFDLVVLPQHDLTRGENVMVTRAALLAVRATLPDGPEVRFGSNAVKDVAGYDLKRLYIDSGATCE